MKKPSLMQRLRAKKRNQSILAGVTWYNAASWAEVKASASDPECFEDSFPAWEKMANLARRELQRSGVRAVECHIVPQDFFAWCEANGKENNAAARAEFVSETLSAAGGAKN
ncbi:MAG TPA: hypothetical protein VIU93_14710 [Gallionellaceae bacterium]